MSYDSHILSDAFLGNLTTLPELHAAARLTDQQTIKNSGSEPSVRRHR